MTCNAIWMITSLMFFSFLCWCCCCVLTISCATGASSPATVGRLIYDALSGPARRTRFFGRNNLFAAPSPVASPEKGSELPPDIITQPTGIFAVLLHRSRVKWPHSPVAANIPFLVLQFRKSDTSASLSCAILLITNTPPTTLPRHRRAVLATAFEALHEL
jgi:hypothetical protein